MKKVIIAIVGFVVVAVASIVCGAQPCEIIQGTISDAKTGEPLPGANISTPHHKSGTSTDTAGYFSIKTSPGDTLLISFIGYEIKQLPVQSLRNCVVNIQLVPSVESMVEVIIQAERIIAEEFTSRKIRKMDIYTNPSAKADPILAVNSTPSATTTDESANISLRGGSPAETGIFLNNVPVSDAVRYSQLNGIGTFSIFNTALVSNVQVYAGNPPLEYGNSTSGLIALQTEESIPEEASNTLSVTLANLGLYTSQKVNKRSSLFLFTNYQPSAAIRILNPASLKDLKSFSSADAGIHYYYQLPGQGVIKIFNYSVKESYKFRYTQPTYDGIFHQQKIRNMTVANFRKRINKKEIGFNQGINFSKANYEYSILKADIKLKDLFSSFYIHQIDEPLEWKTGITYDYKGSDYEGSSPVYSFAIGEQHPVFNAAAKDNIRNPEWFGYVKRYMGAKWIIGSGVRKNLVFEKDNSYLSYQGNIHFKPFESWGINLSAGKYYKYQLPQGESREPYLIQSRQYSLDIFCKERNLETTASLFYKEGFMNDVETTVYGLELFAHYRINSKLKFQMSLTSLDAAEISNDIERPSTYNIGYFLRGNCEYKYKATWTINGVFLLRQGSYYYAVERIRFDPPLQAYEPMYADEPSRLPSYNILDITLNKIFPVSKNIVGIAFLSAGNTLNFKNVRDYTYNFDYSQKQPLYFSQRTIYAGMIFNF